MEPRTTTEVSHLAQLRKMKTFDLLDRKFEQFVLRLLQESEHFVFTAVPDPQDPEIKASEHAMQEASVWHLPHRICTFEFTATLSVGYNDPQQRIAAQIDGVRMIVLCVEDEGEPRIVAHFMRVNPATHNWACVHFSRMEEDGTLPDPQPGETKVDIGVFPMRHDVVPLGALTVNGKTKHLDTTETSSAVSAIASAMLVMLATRGVKRERWIGNQKCLVGRREPANAYTRVMIAETLASGHASPVSGDRHKVRLHMRRGHTRNQPHGPGRQYVRQIWIEPCLVGYEEEGRITHDHYETYRTKEPTP